MPADLTREPEGILNDLHFGETPRTRFVDWLDAIDVQLLSGPDERVFMAMSAMKKATWKNNVWDTFVGTGEHQLPLFAEVPSFTFLVSGVSRIITHQIVRTRIGVTFSQRGSGDQDIRHDDALVPRSLCRPGYGHALEDYIWQILRFKHWYASVVDTREQSLVMARYLAPQCLSQYIFVHISLLALQQLVGKRLCTYETQEYNRVCELMVERLRAEWPEFAKTLVADCDRPGGCHYMRAGSPKTAGSMYLPDQKHDVFAYNPADYVYQATRDDMLWGPKFKERLYVGYDEAGQVGGGVEVGRAGG